ncbi:MAG: bacillithiol biosynthesis deacetylase BshB1 [Bacteroidetes bacterium]|nr:bacillithiol biosynthesis deacetylase BshB1 [Bacteroidota bacterium]
MKLDILAFGAHPDDVELSCSGTILKNISEGKKVGIVDLTRGELGTRGTAAIREKEAKNAAKILGVSFRENLKLPDGFFEINKKNILKVIQKIRHYKPDVVLAPAISDRHPDHGRAAQLIAEASFLSGLPRIGTKEKSKKQPSWRPKAVYHYIQYRKHKPDFAIDITPYIEKKMEAIQAFASQFYNPVSKEPETLISHPKFFHYVRQREMEYGKLIGAQYAEGFNVMEEYRGEVLV